MSACSIAAETVVSQTTVEDGSSALFELIGFVFCNGKNDYEYWEVGLPESVQNRIMEILDDYETWGCSIRGTAAELCEELSSNEKGA